MNVNKCQYVNKIKYKVKIKKIVISYRIYLYICNII